MCSLDSPSFGESCLLSSHSHIRLLTFRYSSVCGLPYFWLFFFASVNDRTNSDAWLNVINNANKIIEALKVIVFSPGYTTATCQHYNGEAQLITTTISCELCVNSFSFSRWEVTLCLVFCLMFDLIAMQPALWRVERILICARIVQCLSTVSLCPTYIVLCYYCMLQWTTLFE